MTYVISISGHSESKAGEARALAAAADCAEAVGAEGVFSFSGNHFVVSAGAPQDAVAKAREVVAEYNASADADDQVEDPS